MDGYSSKKFDSLGVLVRQDIADACPPGGLEQFCRCLFAEPPEDRLIKKGRYKTLCRAELGATSCIIKTYKNKGIAGMLKSALLPSRARQEFTAAAYIHGQGIVTAAPLMLAEKKTLGLVHESAVVLAFIEEAQELREFFFYDRSILPAERWRVAEEFGRLTAAIFHQGVFQYDFALQNFLIRREPDRRFGLYFIDFERVRLKKFLSRKQKVDILARLARVGIEVSLKDRLRFLRGYLAGEPDFAETLHAAAAEMIEATVAAIAKDRHRGRITSMYTHASYDRIAQDGRTGLCRKGTDKPVLLSAVAALSGREPAGQVVIRHAGKALAMRALYFEPEEAAELWAALTALKIAGMPLALPQALVCSEITGCLVLDPSLAAQCRRYFSSASRSRLFVERHFPADVELLKSLLAKL